MSKQSNPEAMKWPTNKARYDRNYQKLFKEQCPICLGCGKLQVANRHGWELKPCSNCKGSGYIKKG